MGEDAGMTGVAFGLLVFVGSFFVRSWLRKRDALRAAREIEAARAGGTLVEGVIEAGETILSPARVFCVGYGLVLSYHDPNDARPPEVTHRGGWTAGLCVRAHDGRRIYIPKGPITVDGEAGAVNDAQGIYAYLADVRLLDEEQVTSRVAFSSGKETRIEIGQAVSIVVERLSPRAVPSAYRDAPLEFQAQGTPHVRVG